MYYDVCLIMKTDCNNDSLFYLRLSLAEKLVLKIPNVPSRKNYVN